MDDQPSRSYSIDDLDALTLLMENERWPAIWRVLFPDDDAEERDDHGLIAMPTPADYPRWLAEIVLARNSNDGRTLRILSASIFRDVRCNVAANPHTPVDTLRDMVASGYAQAIANPALNAADLEFYAATLDCYQGALMRIANNPNTPQHIIDRLAEDPRRWVRISTIRRCGPSVLDRLAHDPDPEVRGHVGHVPQLSITHCELLADDPNEQVRRAVADNREAPPPSVLDVLSRDTCTSVRKAVAGNPLITTDQARRLLTDPEPDVRVALASNRSAPSDVLTALAHPRNCVDIRNSVARNPACPRDLRSRLATRDRSPHVRATAGGGHQ